MKYIILFLLYTIYYAPLFCQAPVIQTEGFLEVYHPEDQSSLYIGEDAGSNLLADHSESRFNTFVGSKAGSGNRTGIANSFFGRFAGNNNASGSHNSFFGRAA